MSDQYDGPQMAQRILRLQEQLAQAREEIDFLKRNLKKNWPECSLMDELQAKLTKLERVRVAAENATANHVPHENSCTETRTVEIWEKEFLDLRASLREMEEQ